MKTGGVGLLFGDATGDAAGDATEYGEPLDRAVCLGAASAAALPLGPAEVVGPASGAPDVGHRTAYKAAITRKTASTMPPTLTALVVVNCLRSDTVLPLAYSCGQG